MLVTLLIRIAVWLTFLLLIAGEIAAIVMARRFVHTYVRKHRALEVRVESIERRLQISEGENG